MKYSLSILPSVLLSRHLLNFGMMQETQMKLCMTEPDFPEIFFCPKNWENRPKMHQKQGFLNLLKKLGINFYWICSLMKICIICCVLAQIPYLGKFLFLGYGPKYSQIAGFFNQTSNQWNKLRKARFLASLKLTLCQEWIDGMNWFSVC